MAQSFAGKEHYLNTEDNTIESSQAGEWTQMGSTVGLSARLQGVYWSSTTPGAELKLKDSNGEIVYHYVVTAGITPAIDLLETPLTVRTPFSYYDSIGGNKIILFGEYLDYPD